MPLGVRALRRLLWRRVAAVNMWRNAERAQAAEHHKAVRRILDQAADLPADRGQVRR